MKLLLLTLGLLASALAGDSTAKVCEGNGEFALDMYNTVAKDEGNVVCSPFSAHAALSMLSQGSAGSTKEALTKALHVSDVDVAAEGYNDIMKDLNTASDVDAVVANKVFVKEGYNFKKSFKSTVTEKFQAEAECVDFEKSADAAKEINTWVDGKTNHKISKLFEDDAFDQDTRAVLVNTLYFKGEWKDPFDPAQESSFHCDGGKEVQVPFMGDHRTARYLDCAELDAKMLELPFKNEKFSMVFILPNEKSTVRDVENRLETVDMVEKINEMHTEDLLMSIPKFKIEQEIDLKDTLTEMGLGELYEKNCNLSGMVEGADDLKIDRAVQKVYINVEEKGCEAGAATEFTPAASSLPAHSFHATHPYLFTLVSRHNDKINFLFTGRVSDPSIH